uniref:Uncharacterized protein n=1 Tax=Equus asinus TaxID=9793 RepID=A0A8C4LNQ0_EQUAS
MRIAYSVWKTPRVPDSMPEVVVKIIGSKHFRYLAEKPKTEEYENLKAATQTALQKSVTHDAGQVSRDPSASTNPTDHQADHNPADVEESKNWWAHSCSPCFPLSLPLPASASHYHLSLFFKIPNQASVHCSSVLTGDQSLSCIHGLPRRNLRDWALEQMAKGSSGQPEHIGQRPSGARRDNTFLLALVRRELQPRPLSSGLLDKLQKDLKILDPISSGFLLQSQLSHLFLRHEVPLQLPTIKILCQRFSRKGSPEMVNYGKLLWFLKVAASDDPQQSKRVVDRSPRRTQGGRPHSQSTAPRDPSSQSEGNRSLLDVLEMARRTTNGKLNIENLNLMKLQILSYFQVRAICRKHGLYLTLSLLETLLNHQDLGYKDEIKWQSFVELLSRASSDLSSDLSTGEFSYFVILFPERTPKTLEEDLQPENPTAETSAPKDPLSSLKIRPVSQPFLNPVMKNESEESETWIERFRKLEDALYLCDLNNAGEVRTRRLIHNYNLIYDLALSPRKIDQASRRFCSAGNMLLEPALRYLKEL